jgi:hypothetical protein
MSADLNRRKRMQQEFSLTPKSMSEVMDLSKALAPSVSVPAALRNKPGDVLAVLLTGIELGFSPMQSLRAFCVIDGRTCLYAEAMAALVRKSPVCKRFDLIETSATKCSMEAQRVGDEKPTRLEWTLKMAETAGLMRNRAWVSFPEAMLRARCTSALAKAKFSDVLLGLYTREEIESESFAAHTLERTDHVGHETTLIGPRPAAPTPSAPPEHERTVVAATPGPAPTPLPAREPGDDDGLDTVDQEVLALGFQIESAASGEVLHGLVPRIKALPADAQALLRTRFSAALKRLAREDAKS